jgi:PHD/YefM family antitoxin component YafN of YafNO toxin-antitoxin module
MTTKFVGMKDFRQNISKYTAQANSKKFKLIVLKKNVPVLEVTPIDEKDFAYTKLSKEIKKSEQEIKDGNSYTQEEVMMEFGLL